MVLYRDIVYLAFFVGGLQFEDDRPILYKELCIEPRKKPKPKKMSQKDIESVLGYPIEIVKEEE